jgi:hypothetical protein
MTKAELTKIVEGLEATASDLRFKIVALSDEVKAAKEASLRVSDEEAEYTEAMLKDAMKAAYMKGVEDANAQVYGQDFELDLDEDGDLGGWSHHSLHVSVSGTANICLEDQVEYLNETPKDGRIDWVFEQWWKQFEPRLKTDTEATEEVDKVDDSQ